MPIGQSNLYRESYQDISRADIVKCVVTDVVNLGSSWGANVMDSNGNIYNNVAVISSLAGSSRAFSVIPIYGGQEVYVLKTSPNKPKYIIGGIFKSSVETVDTFIPFIPIEQDFDAICRSDYVVNNNGNQLNLSSANGVIIKSDGNVRIQLSDEGKFKISKDGVAGEFALNATRFLVERKPYIDELNAKIAKLEETTDALLSYIGSLEVAIETFAGAGVSNTTGPLAPLNAPFSSLQLTMQTTVPPYKNTVVQKQSDLVNLPLRSSADHTKDCSKAINFDVLLPAGYTE